MSSPASLDPDRFRKRLAKRHRQEAIFRLSGLAAIGAALGVLVLLLGTVLVQGLPAFETHTVRLDVVLDGESIDPNGDASRASLRAGNHAGVVKRALHAELPEVRGRSAKRRMNALLSRGAAFQIQDALLADPSLVGKTVTFTLPLSDDAALYLKGHVDRNVEESARRLTDDQLDMLDTLVQSGQPVRVLRISTPRPGAPFRDGLDAYTIGALMMHFMLETILTADLMGIDPFDQPAVEAGKIRARDYLSAYDQLQAKPDLDRTTRQDN